MALDANEVAGRLHTFLTSEFPGQGNELTEETNLLDEWFLDSLGIIDVVMFLEEQFGIAIERHDINGDNFHSIASLTRFVLSRGGV